jgi:uncharacterized SAM-binding protein YcdF (DUF218 family)
MLFWLKKFVSFWLMPLPVCVTAMVVGLLLMRSARRARLGRGLLTGGLVLLVLFSNKFVSRALMRPLEARYASIPELRAGAPLPANLAACRYVVVLGSGNGLEPNASPNNLLMPSALERIVEAVRIVRTLPEAKLIVSGPGDVPNEPTHAEVLARTAELFGIARERIIKIENGRDTEEESRAIRKIVGDARIALVTSASHMPRAMALCRSAGVAAVPCPTDFNSHPNEAVFFNDFLWDIESLGRSTLAVRERVGYLWIWLRGKT